MTDIIERLRKPPVRFTKELRKTMVEAANDIEKLREALKIIRSLVNEGSVPRYTVTPGAALNATIEEVIDPLIRRFN